MNASIESSPSSRGMRTIVISASALLALVSILVYKAYSRTLQVAEKFRDSKITTTFRSNLKTVASTKGNILELATLESDEFFRRSDERHVFGIYMGTTVAEITARATFRYHLRLSDSWNLNVRDNICVVRAPFFRPSLPVAIQTDRMLKSAASGWARFDKHDKLNELESCMTPDLERRASDAEHMEAVRERCRQSVAQFVKDWLMREDHWRKDRFSVIIVEFPDEAAQRKNTWAIEATPTLLLGN